MILRKIIIYILLLRLINVYAQDTICDLEHPALWVNTDDTQFRELVTLHKGESISQSGSKETDEYVLFQCNNFGTFTRSILYRKKDGAVFESLTPVEHTYGQYILQNDNRHIGISEINAGGAFKIIKTIDFAKISEYAESRQVFHGDFMIDYSSQSEYYLTIYRWDGLELVKYFEITEPVWNWYLGKNSIYYIKRNTRYITQDKDLAMLNLSTLETIPLGKEFFRFINGFVVSGYNGQTGFIDLQTDKSIWFSGNNTIDDHYAKIISIENEKYPVRNIITITDSEFIFTSTGGIYSYSPAHGKMTRLYDCTISFSGYFRNTDLYCSNNIPGSAYIFSLSKRSTVYQFNLKWVNTAQAHYYEAAAVDFFAAQKELFMFAVFLNIDHDK